MKAIKNYKLSVMRWIGKNDSISCLRFLQLYCRAEIGIVIVILQKKKRLSITEEWRKEEKIREKQTKSKCKVQEIKTKEQCNM